MTEFQASSYTVDDINVNSLSVTFNLFQLPPVLSILSPLPIMTTTPSTSSPKIKKSSVLPLVEQWEEYMATNHSIFAAIDQEHFLAGTRLMVALEEVGSFYLKEFRRDCRKFLEDFAKCVLSTVVARSALGRVLSFLPSFIGWWRRSCSNRTVSHVA